MKNRTNRKNGIAVNALRSTIERLEARDCPAISLISEAGPLQSDKMANGNSHVLAMSNDNNWVVFASTATDLVSGMIDTPGTPDLFLSDLNGGSTTLITHYAGQPLKAAGGSSYGKGSVSISARGDYVAYASTNPHLVLSLADAANTSDIFLYRRASNSTSLVSHSSSSLFTTGNGESDSPIIQLQHPNITTEVSVVYRSRATNLQEGQVDSNGKADLLRYDIGNAKNTYLTKGNEDSDNPMMFNNTNYTTGSNRLFFQSKSTNIVAGQIDTPGTYDVFSVDLFEGSSSSQLISNSATSKLMTANGNTALADVAVPSYLHSGTTSTSFAVAMISTATNLVAGQTGTPGQSNAFIMVYNPSSGYNNTLLVSGSNGSATQTANASTDHIVIGDMRYQADHPHIYYSIRTSATDVVAGQIDNNTGSDIFFGKIDLHNFAPHFPHTAKIASHSIASVLQTGNLPVSNNDYFDMQGEVVLFSSPATDYLAAFVDGNGSASDLYMTEHTNSAGNVILISQSTGSPSTSSNLGVGSGVVFGQNHLALDSSSTNLVSSMVDAPNTSDVFVRRYGILSALSKDDPEAAVAQESTISQSGTPSRGQVTSTDGRYTVYTSRTPSLPNGQFTATDYWDVFLYDSTLRKTTLVSHGDGKHAYTPTISGDGRFVAYALQDIYYNNTSYITSIIVYDRNTGSSNRISSSLSYGQVSILPNSYEPIISTDGKYIVYRTANSEFATLVSGSAISDSNMTDDIILHDRVTLQNKLVSRAWTSSTTTANGMSNNHSISADGSFVTFTSTASNLTFGTNDTNGVSDVFLYSRATGVNTLVSQANGSNKAAGGLDPSISNDGRFIAFESSAKNLVANQIDPLSSSIDVFLYDRLNPTNTKLVTHTSSSLTTSARGFDSEISGDGSTVVFRSSSPNLIVGQSGQNSNTGVFFYSRATGTIGMATRDAGSTTTAANGQTDAEPSISDNGQRITYQSTSTNLISSTYDPHGKLDVFVFDRTTGLNTLASHVNGVPLIPGNNESKNAVISSDGSTVLFTSLSTNLISTDTNAFLDVYAFRFTANPPAASMALGLDSSPMSSLSLTTSGTSSIVEPATQRVAANSSSRTGPSYDLALESPLIAHAVQFPTAVPGSYRKVKTTLQIEPEWDLPYGVYVD